MGKTMTNDAIVTDNSRCMARDPQRYNRIVDATIEATLPDSARAAIRKQDTREGK